MIGNLLVLTGIFIILFGFLILIIGTAIGMRGNPEPGKGHSKRKGEFGKKTDSGNLFDFEKHDKKEPHAGKAKSKVRGGGVIMLGPIPIIFGSDAGSAYMAVILAIVLIVLSLLISKGIIF